MKRKDILLDFTSLLDVTLIVIFFFVIFSHLDGEENKRNTEAKIQELNEAIQETESSRISYEEKAAQLEEEIKIVQEESERRGSNINELLEYTRNNNLKIILDMQSDGWGIRVIHNEEPIAYLEKSNDLANDLIRAMESAGYEIEQTIFCDFVYDGQAAGTRSAYRSVRECIEEVHRSYKFLYVSETDLSIGKD